MFIEPMLLETTQTPFNHTDYIFEPKIDGHRLILSRQNSITRLFTRHNNDCTRQYPELYDLNADDIILDGEVVCTDRSTGTIDFESVMERFSAKKSDKIRRMVASLPATYVVFDIIRYNGEDLRGWPLLKRKELLARLDLGNPRISVIPFVEREGMRLFDEIVARQLEGIVGKRKESAYVGRRTPAWQKIINWMYADVIITGWRKEDFGWLCAVDSGNGQLRSAGIIEFVPHVQRKAFYNVIQPFVTSEDSAYVYVEPRLRARVKMRNWTKKGLLRSPVFVGFNYEK